VGGGKKEEDWAGKWKEAAFISTVLSSTKFVLKLRGH